MSAFQTKITNPCYYIAEIQNLHDKYFGLKKNLFIEEPNNALSVVNLNKKQVARHLIKEIQEGTFKFRPARISPVVIGKKERDLYKFHLFDRIMHGVISRVISELVQSSYSNKLFSYRRKRSSYLAVKQFAAFVRAYRKKVSIPQERGLYVLRQDIRQYTDSIPVGKNAPVWGELKKELMLENTSDNWAGYLWSLVEDVIRPQIHRNGGYYQNILGIPTGSPITAIMYNMCGCKLDKLCAGLDGSFYARFSDDFIFAHPDPEVVKAVSSRIRSTLYEDGLSINHGKSKVLYFNGAARPSHVWPQAEPVSHVSFLGMQISFKGETSLGRSRTRGFLRELRNRLLRAIPLLNQESLSESGKAICEITNHSIITKVSAAIAQNQAIYLNEVVTDRAYLRGLDYKISLLIAELVSGTRGPRAFRTIDPSRMRREWGLLSLFHYRNTNKALR